MIFDGKGHSRGEVTCPFASVPRARRWRICILAIFICATVACAVAQSEADAGTGSRIVALETLWFEAFKQKDTRAIDSILDSTVFLVNSDGSTQTKGDYLASLRISFTQADSLDSQTLPESMSVKVFGTTVIVTGVYRIKGVRHGKPFLRRERFVDTWKYRAGLWLIVGTQATPVLN